jgi:DNA repair exonuclease SbcCD nuclease subunit
VHQREVVSEDPWIVFPGNLQGRHARELGEKGAEVVSVSGGAIQSVEHRVLDVVRWVQCEVDVSGAQSADEVIERVTADLLEERDRHGDRLVAARVKIVGRTEAHTVLIQDLVAHQQLVRAAVEAADSQEERLWLEKVEFATRSTFDLDALRTEEGPLGELLRTLGEIAADEEALASLGSTLDGLAKKDALLFGRTHVSEGASSGLEPPGGFPSLAATGTDRVAAVRALCGELDELIVARLLEVN